MKTVGILGGFGPESTAKFQLEIVDIFRTKKIKTRPPILIWNTPVPLKVEKNLIIRSKGVKEFLSLLIEGAERLNKAGADFLVIPCNTLHVLIKDLRHLVKLPIISIIEETASRLNEERVKTVGIIGTRLIIESNLHQNSLRLHGIQSVLPSEDDQDLINHCVNLILANKNTSWVENTLLHVMRELKIKNAKDILLACTDLRPFIKGFPGIKIHDTLQILANATVEKMIDETRII